MKNNPVLTPSLLKAKATGFILASLLMIFTASAQNAGINADGSAPDKSAMLDIKSPNKGLLIPRVSLKSTTDVTTVPTPQTSLLVFNTTAAGSGTNAVVSGFYFFNGTVWSPLTVAGGTAGSGWGLSGNGGTNAANQFIGTTDNRPLSFRVNNKPAGSLTTNGNAFWGIGSGVNTTTGFSNVAIGNAALHENQITSNAVAIGDSALFSTGTGQTFPGGFRSVAIGSKAAFSNTSANGLVAIGFNALFSNTTGGNNTAVGNLSSLNNTTGISNTAIGASSLLGNTDGAQNVAVGSQALSANTVGNGNTALGDAALFAHIANDDNTAVGRFSLGRQQGGQGNTAIGSGSLDRNVTGALNSAIGFAANVGSGALTNATAIGSRARVDCSNCLVLGSVANVNDATSNVKVGIGVTAPLRPLSFNSILGDKISLFESPIGHYGFGVQPALLQIHTDNTAGDIAFGSGSSASFFETMRIRGGGSVGIGTKTPAQRLHVIGNILASGSITSFSDLRFKQNIQPLTKALESINRIQAVYYNWNQTSFPDHGFTSERQVGFIAQDIEKYYPEMVLTGADGYKSVDYGKMTAVLLEGMKEQQQQIVQQQQQIDALKKLVEEKLKK